MQAYEGYQKKEYDTAYDSCCYQEGMEYGCFEGIHSIAIA